MFYKLFQLCCLLLLSLKNLFIAGIERRGIHTNHVLFYGKIIKFLIFFPFLAEESQWEIAEIPIFMKIWNKMRYFQLNFLKLVPSSRDGKKCTILLFQVCIFCKNLQNVVFLKKLKYSLLKTQYFVRMYSIIFLHVSLFISLEFKCIVLTQFLLFSDFFRDYLPIFSIFEKNAFKDVFKI